MEPEGQLEYCSCHTFSAQVQDTNKMNAQVQGRPNLLEATMMDAFSLQVQGDPTSLSQTRWMLSPHRCKETEPP